jgi:putative ABC transport system permease protein
MFMQLGFLNAVLDSQVKLLAGIKADLVITSRLKSRLGFQEPFARRRLEEARGVPGVAAVSPLYIALADWKNPETRNSRRIRVIGIPPEDWAILNLNLEPLAFVLREYDAALIDLRSKNVYGPRRAGVVTELAGRRIRVMGTFTLGTDFDNDGTVIIGEMNFLKLFPEQRTSDPQLSRVELGLVQLRAIEF